MIGIVVFTMCLVYTLSQISYSYISFTSTQACENSAIQCVEYCPTTTTASNFNRDSCKENLVEDSALFGVEIRKPMSLSQTKGRCENLKN